MKNANDVTVLQRLAPLLTVLVGCLLITVALQSHSARKSPRKLSEDPGVELSHRTADALQSEGSRVARRSRMFIGVWTGPDGAYLDRRRSIRETWLTPELRARYENELGMIIRFMMGRLEDAAVEKKVQEEAAQHGDIVRMNVVDNRDNMGKKTMETFKAGVEQFDPEWIVKMDDDIYLMPERILAAAAEWERGNKGYIGCPRVGGRVGKEPGGHWYDPLHELIGEVYPKYYFGSIYVLSREVVDNIILRNYHNLRHQRFEDAMMGQWMVTFDVQHGDDKRLCSYTCSPTAVVIQRVPECQGLCNPVEDMYALHKEPLCQGPLATNHIPWEASGQK